MEDVNSYLCLREGHPQRPADWRWRLGALTGEERRGLRKRYDFYALKASAYLDQRGRCSDFMDRIALDDQYPHLAEAVNLRENASFRPDRYEIEARFIAGSKTAEVARAVNYATETVAWYEAVFYDVGDRVTNASYVYNHLIGEQVHNNLVDGAYELLWKLVAYHGKVEALNLAIAKLRTRSVADAEQAIAFFNDQYRLLMSKQRVHCMLTMKSRDPFVKTQLIAEGNKLEEMDRSQGAASSQDAMVACIHSFLSGMKLMAAPPPPRQIDAEVVDVPYREPRDFERIRAAEGFPIPEGRPAVFPPPPVKKRKEEDHS